MQPTPPERRIHGEDVLFLLGAVLGAISGAVYGDTRFGIAGAALMLPIGVIVGLGLSWVLGVTLMLLVLFLWVLWMLFTQGPSETRRFLRYGPKTGVQNSLPRATEERTE
jgi:hypothetical protein